MVWSVALAQEIDQAMPSAETGMHGGGSFPPFDATFFGSHLFWLIICFGVFYLFMARVIVPRLGEVIETRRERIAGDLDQAARMKQQADAAIDAYETELMQARQSATAIARAAAEKAKEQAERERRKAEDALEKTLSEAESRIGAIRDAALRDVGMIAQETAGEIIRHLVGSTVDKARLAKTVKQLA